MSGTTISGLPAATQVLLSDLLPIVELGSPNITKRATVQQFGFALGTGFVPTSGATMTGPLYLSGDPAQALQAATKQYVDAHAGGGGGGGTGIPEAPLDGFLYGRATASWVRALPLGGGTLTGLLTLAGPPVGANDAASKAYVDAHAGSGGIPDAPTTTGVTYGRLNGTWTPVLPLAGGTVSGNLTVSGTLSPNAISGVSTASISSINAANITTGALTSTGNASVAGTLYANTAGNALFLGVSGGVPQVAFATNYELALTSGHWYSFGSPGGYICLIDGSNGNLQITGAGYQPGGGPWIATSDDRVKQNVAPYLSGLDAVCDLEPISFQYNGQGGIAADGKTYFGLSAQSTQPIMPELVVTIPPGENTLPNQLGTNLAALPFALCNAVRELRDRVQTLEAAAAR